MEVAERIAAPQRSSTRTIYKSKWDLFEKWCRENSVDFSTPSVKQVSDFFMCLYQDLNALRPLMVLRLPLLTPWAQWGSIFPKAQTLTGYCPVSTGIVPKVPGIFQNRTFLLLYPRREAGILWIHHRPRPQRFLVSDLQSTFLSGFLSYLADGLIW